MLWVCQMFLFLRLFALPVITVQTATTGPRDVPTKWAGRWSPFIVPYADGLSAEPALWTVTLQPSACQVVCTPLRAVVALAAYGTPQQRNGMKWPPPLMLPGSGATVFGMTFAGLYRVARPSALGT